MKTVGIVRHGALARSLLVAVGVLFLLAAAAVFLPLSLVTIGGWGDDGGDDAARAGGLALMAALGTYGVLLARRGIRGTSRGPSNALARAAAERRAARVVGILTLAGGVVALVATGGRPPAPSVSQGSISAFLWFFYVGALLVPAHVLVHEAGHAAGALLGGMRVDAMRIGPLVVGRRDGRMRAWLDHRSFGGLMGLASASHVDGRTRRFAHAAWMAGGLVATAAATLACRAGAQALGADGLAASGPAAALLQAGYFGGAFLLVANVIPYRLRSGFETDGARLLGLLLPSSPGATLLRRLALLPSGHRPRDWGTSPEEILAAAEGDARRRDPLLLLALAVARDRGDLAGGDGILRRALAPAPRRVPVLAMEFELQAVLADALLRGDAAGARARFAPLGPHPSAHWYPLLAESAVLLAEGQRAEAADALGRWKEASDASGIGERLRVGNEWAILAIEARLA